MVLSMQTWQCTECQPDIWSARVERHPRINIPSQPDICFIRLGRMWLELMVYSVFGRHSSPQFTLCIHFSSLVHWTLFWLALYHLGYDRISKFPKVFDSTLYTFHIFRINATPSPPNKNIVHIPCSTCLKPGTHLLGWHLSFRGICEAKTGNVS